MAPDDDDTDRVLADHETRLRAVERTVQEFVDRERTIIRGMSSTSKVLLLAGSLTVAVLSVLHFFGVRP